MLQAILSPIIFVIGIINMFGGVVGGIWLLVKGEWGVVLFSIGLLFVGSTFLISLLLLPSIGLGSLSVFLISKKKYLISGILANLSQIYIIIIMAAWGFAFMFFFLSKARLDTLIPMILLSYGPATGPWAYMASNDKNFSVSHIATFFLEIAYLTTGVIIIFTDHVGFKLIFGTYLGIMAFGLIICMLYSWFILGTISATENEIDNY